MTLKVTFLYFIKLLIKNGNRNNPNWLGLVRFFKYNQIELNQTNKIYYLDWLDFYLKIEPN